MSNSAGLGLDSRSPQLRCILNAVFFFFFFLTKDYYYSDMGLFSSTILTKGYLEKKISFKDPKNKF